MFLDFLHSISKGVEFTSKSHKFVVEPLHSNPGGDVEHEHDMNKIL